ncbi:MAG: sigma-70 family RNA polymerase sigma factor [Chloroflexi bacterium]|nr:sigma-70 family RNA polymerase sigma factor [Chloroflexota bacterium]
MMNEYEQELAQRLRNDDEEALAELYDRYGAWVYGLALRVVHDPHLAQEVTQDVFFKVWQHRRTYDPKRSKWSTWLLVIARTTALDRLRREQRRPAWPWDESLENSPDRTETRDARELHLAIRALLDRLPPEQRQVVELAFFEGYTHREIAKRLNLPLGTVKTRLRLAMDKLRTWWQETERTAQPSHD